jgi:DNA polymerase III subunit gamma/tau
LSAVAGGGAVRAAMAQPTVAPRRDELPETLQRLQSFDQLAELIRQSDVLFLMDIERYVRLVHYAPGRIEFQPTEDAPRELAARLKHRLQGLTGAQWGISVVSSGGGPTLAEQKNADLIADHAAAAALPLVQAVLAAFPGARVVEVRDPAAMAAAEALPEVEDEWDPFEAD